MQCLQHFYCPHDLLCIGSMQRISVELKILGSNFELYCRNFLECKNLNSELSLWLIRKK